MQDAIFSMEEKKDDISAITSAIGDKLRIFEKTDGKLASHTAQNLDLVQDRRTRGSFYSPGSMLLFSHKCHIQHAKFKNSMYFFMSSFFFRVDQKKQDDRPGRSVKKVAHCTQVNDIWPFGPLVLSWIYL